MSGLQWTCSNQLEQLLEGLKEELFPEDRLPFEKNIVVVPHPIMKSWLMRSIMQDRNIGIAFGFQVAYLKEILPSFMASNKKSIPQAIELAIAIDRIFQEGLLEAPLLSTNENDALRALEIAELFLRYGEFAHKEMEQWLETKAAFWQQELWQKLFEKTSCWQTPYQSLCNDPIYKMPKSLHLFAPSPLSLIKWDFLEKLSKKTKVYLWVLSPSRMLWSDLKTEKEGFLLLKKWGTQKETREWLLEEDNPLIANNGKLGRNWMKALEDGGANSKEVFVVPSSIAEYPAYQECLLDGIKWKESESLSLLQAVQADLTMLRSSESLITFSENDRSIEIHRTDSIQREVESLHQSLLQLFNHSSLSPKDILVLVPNLQNYEPYIRRSFEGEESPLPIEIFHHGSLNDASYVQTFFHLIDLASSRWEIERVFELLHKPQFKLPDSLTFEELDELEARFKKEGVRWGIDSAHREMHEMGNDERGTWKAGWEAILRNYGLRISSEEFLNDPALSFISSSSPSFSQAEAFGACFEMLQCLRHDLAPLEANVYWTLDEWSKFLLNLMEYYLVPKTEEDKTACEEVERVFTQLETWHIKQPKALIHFKALRVYIEKLFKESSFSLREGRLNVIRFATPALMHGIPASVLVFMGLNGDEFPRIEKKSSFDCLYEKRLVPFAADEDRYFFLESLLSARKKWILTYAASSEQEPSLVIQELLQYLDKRYMLGGKPPSECIHYKHYPFPFDHRYFVSQAPVKSLSPRSYRNAYAMVASQGIRSSPHLFSPPLPIDRCDLSRFPNHITLEELKKALFHPLKHYLNKNLNIYLKETKVPYGFLEEFQEEDLWEGEWLKWALKYPMDRVISLAEQKGKFPLNPWKDVAKNRLKQKLKNSLEALERFNICPQDVCEVEFAHGILKPVRINPWKWKMPPLEMVYRNKKVAVTGVIPYVSPKGILSPRNRKTETWITSLPELLLHQALPDHFSSRTLYFLKTGEFSDVPKTPMWENLFDHYLCTLHQPAPLLPSWITPILKNEPEQLKKAIHYSLKDPQRKDPYLKWMAHQLAASNTDEIIGQWKNRVEELFKELVFQRSADEEF